MDAQPVDPNGFRRLKVSKLSICIPEYMTPTQTWDDSRWCFDALSRGESIAVREILKDSSGSADQELDELRKLYGDCIEEVSSTAKEFNVVGSDSVILNGCHTRFVDYELMRYGTPAKTFCKLALIDSGDRYYLVNLSKVIEGGQDCKSLVDNMLLGVKQDSVVEK